MKSILLLPDIFGSFRKASNTYMLHNLTDLLLRDVRWASRGEDSPLWNKQKIWLNLENLKKRILSK